MNKMNIICKQCSEVFQAWKSRKRKYCSLKCRDKSYEGKPSWNKGLRKKDHPSMDRIGFQEGEKNPMWQGGDSDRERRNAEYKAWQLAVWMRDNYTCQLCGEVGGKLNAHHIVQWIESIELRYEIENGITYCIPCHIKIHSMVGKKHTNKH